MLNFFGSKNILGVDIGTASIKIVEIKKGPQKPQFLNYGVLEASTHLERPNEAIQTSSLKLSEKQTANALKELLAQMKTKTKDAIASVPIFSSFVTFFDLPLMPDTDTRKVIGFQIKQYLPLPVSEVEIEWMKVGEKETEEGKKQQILLISIPKEQIIKYQNIFKLAGLKLKAIEIEGLGLTRALADPKDPTPTLIIDIGCYSTNIIVVENGYLRYNNSSDYAGASLTRAIANGLGIDVRRAEEIKKSKGLLAAGGEYEISTLMLPFLDVIIGEAKRAINSYQVASRRDVKEIILTGGGANLLGIEKYFKKETNKEVKIGNALLKVDYPLELEPLAKEIGTNFSLAIGLGIKELI